MLFRSDLLFGVMVKKTGLPEDQIDGIADAYNQVTHQAFYEDIEIWHTKTRVDNPILCDGDGPISRLRKWYQQFYVDREEAPKYQVRTVVSKEYDIP